jgi:hypothetical protein
VKKNVENSQEQLQQCSKAACFGALHMERCELWRIIKNKTSVTGIVMQNST